MVIVREIYVYDKFYNSLLSKLIDIENDSIKAMLCDENYTPDLENHQFKDDITDEVDGTGYDEGGVEVTTVTVSNPSAGVIKVDCDDIEFEGIFVTLHYMVLYDDTPALDEDKPIIAVVDYNENLEFNGENFKSIIDADGIVTITNENE
jgi:hypothetical protein